MSIDSGGSQRLREACQLKGLGWISRAADLDQDTALPCLSEACYDGPKCLCSDCACNSQPTSYSGQGGGSKTCSQIRKAALFGIRAIESKRTSRILTSVLALGYDEKRSPAQPLQLTAPSLLGVLRSALRDNQAWERMLVTDEIALDSAGQREKFTALSSTSLGAEDR
jgi:hypothetical protein